MSKVEANVTVTPTDSLDDCPYCGRTTHESWSYCPRCGTGLEVA